MKTHTADTHAGHTHSVDTLAGHTHSADRHDGHTHSEVLHTQCCEVAHTLSPVVAHTLGPEFSHTLSPEVAHTVSSEVAHTLSPEVAHTLGRTTISSSAVSEAPTQTPSPLSDVGSHLRPALVQTQGHLEGRPSRPLAPSRKWALLSGCPSTKSQPVGPTAPTDSHLKPTQGSPTEPRTPPKDRVHATQSAPLNELGPPLEDQEGQQPAKVLVPGPEAPRVSADHRPGQGVLHACRERAGQLEVWLERAQLSLGRAPQTEAMATTTTATAMRQSVEQQLLTCQEMFLEIEQKVASLSSLGSPGPQQEGESLLCKLDLLKANLVSFQGLLQERQSGELALTPAAEQLPLEARQEHSATVHELLSSSTMRSKLLRQNSLQQQKELEQELSEQRDLTKALARQGSRARLLSVDTEDQSSSTARSLPWERADAALERKWSHLRGRLGVLEEGSSLQGDTPQVTDPSGIVAGAEGGGGAGVDGVMGSHFLEDFQVHRVRLRGLSRSATEGDTQGLDESLFDVLSGVVLFLSSLSNLLQSPPRGIQEEDAQRQLGHLQSLSAELDSLRNDLTSQGSDVRGVLGSGSGQGCMDHLCRVLPVVQKDVVTRVKHLEAHVERVTQQQKTVRELHAALLSNMVVIHQTTNERRDSQDSNQRLQAMVQAQQVSSILGENERVGLPSSLLEQATKLEGLLEGALGAVASGEEELRASLELQQLFDGLVHSLEEMVRLGCRRLCTGPGVELHSRARLQEHLSSHVKFFQFLANHLSILQYLSQRVPESALQRWEGVLTEMQETVVQQQKEAVDKANRMHTTLQMWNQWEENTARLHQLLKDVETTLPTAHLDEDSENRLSQKVSLYQTAHRVLEESRARRALTHGLAARLQDAGCTLAGLGGRASGLEACWAALHRKVEQVLLTVDRKRKLGNRFAGEFAAFCDWMEDARNKLDRWSRLTDPSNQDLSELGPARDEYHQFIEFFKELEMKAIQKASVVSTGTQLMVLRESSIESGEVQDADPDLEACSVQNQLRVIEQDWAVLRSDVPLLQQTLHKRWVEKLSPQGALLELRGWLRGAESRLEEHKARVLQNSSTSDLAQVLSHLKECQTELALLQATVDYVNQPGLRSGTLEEEEEGQEDQRGRLQGQTEFAEEQGQLNQRWLSLQGALSSQVNKAELRLRTRKEGVARLQQTNSWLTNQKDWLSVAVTPVSLTELERSISTFQSIEEKTALHSTALLELKKKHLQAPEDCGGVVTPQADCGGDVTPQADCALQACSDLLQQVSAARQTLQRVKVQWDRLEVRLREASTRTTGSRQSLEFYCSHPPLSLRALTQQIQSLQFLRQETEGVDSEWDELGQIFASFCHQMDPSAAVLLEEQLDQERGRWAQVSSDLIQRLKRSEGLLQVWAVYADLAGSLNQRLQALRDEGTPLLKGPPGEDSSAGRLTAKTSLQRLQESTDSLQTDLDGLLEASKDLTVHLGPLAAGLIQSEVRMMSRGIHQLSQSLAGKLFHLQEELKEHQEFDSSLESLEKNLEEWKSGLNTFTSSPHERDTSHSDLLELSALTFDLDELNELSYRLNLEESITCRLQKLNRGWTQASARTSDACSELQTENLNLQSFEEKCESWNVFLQRMEDDLAVDLASTYNGLRDQLRTHQRFQVELSVGHQILHSVIGEALHLLQRGEVEDRSDFILTLSQLREHWQGAVQRASQRRLLLVGLVKHWHLYGRGLGRLQRFLAEARALLPAAGPSSCSLQQLRCSMRDLQHTELLFQRYQSSYIHTLEVGRHLFSMGDERTQEGVQADLATLQEDWDSLQALLARRKELTQHVIQNWERFKGKLAETALQLKDVKTRLSIPEQVEDRTEEINKEAEDSLDDWATSLTELVTMKTDLSQYMTADDVLLMGEQVEHLHCQWDDLCFQVSLRKQEVADRLNAWIIFKEKNQELCEWLSNMENKVTHSADLSIEEMVEKLKKDCVEEINLFSENKTHLKQLGEQLMSASNKTKETESNDCLKDVNDRWQHLFDHIEARVRKLKETLVTVQQLDKNMSRLRTWLSRVEAELSRPVLYDVCHGDEIQRKLVEQQALQRDIEQHTEGVASVLTLCDVLLHDSDVCASDSENDSIQQTTHSLDRRWRNICAMSMERRMRIEETWRLWCKFLEDYSRFEEWLKTAERSAANPQSSEVLYTCAKEELKKFEAFQRQVHERLTQLELVNKQYRRLARENRTDSASKLKLMVHEGNHRWDGLQRRVAAVLRRLKHFTSQREDFEGTRENILVWLTEMDLQLTNVEHFSESDVEDKMRQLNAFQKEITLNTNKIDALIVFGETLIQKSAPLDAVLIEDELEELHSYCQEVFGRVARFHHRLVTRRPVLDEERDTDLEESADLTGASWGEGGEEEEEEEKEEDEGQEEVLSSQRAVGHLLAPPRERSGRGTPVSVDSIPLEWDHTVDVGGSSSHEDDEDATFFSALSDVEVTESSESFVEATTESMRTAAHVKSMTEPPSWHHHPESPERKRRAARIGLHGLGTSPTHSTPFHNQGYAKLMSECTGSIDRVKRVKRILNDEEEEEEEQGLSTLRNADKQTSTAVIERWELLQDGMALPLYLQQGRELISDLGDVTSWLDKVQPELETLQRLPLATGLQEVEGNIRLLKEMQRTFQRYKAQMISVNLRARGLQGAESAAAVEQHEEEEELQDRLRRCNHGWTEACASLERWEGKLHGALMECQEFHQTLHSMLLWLSRAEGVRYAVNVHDGSATRRALLAHRDALVALEEELSGAQQQVFSLQEISSHLLLEATREDSVEAKEKVHVIANKLRLLLRQVANDLHVLDDRLDSSVGGASLGSFSSPLKKVEESQLVVPGRRFPDNKRELKQDTSPARSFFSRVLRAALPLHLFLLLLLVLACLVPMSEEDYSCTLSNNFARSFYPMLRYTNGPPPT